MKLTGRYARVGEPALRSKPQYIFLLSQDFPRRAKELNRASPRSLFHAECAQLLEEAITFQGGGVHFANAANAACSNSAELFAGEILRLGGRVASD
ncbi:MAG: hypothetical protein HC794_06265 [Nitrospiraceae bacterium]|nr:hypothetical protein [Nitrospiraceae bacterium]